MIRDSGLETDAMLLKGRVVVYSVVGCPYCKRAKARLEELKIPYHDINLDAFPDLRADMQERTKKTSVPQIFFNNKHLGGWDDFAEAEFKGTFSEFLGEVADNEVPAEAPQLPVMQRTESGDDCDMSFGIDEYYQLVLDIRKSGLIGDHRYHLRNYKNSFVGSELVDWLVANKNMSRKEAGDMGQELIQRKFGHHVTDDHEFKDGYFFYRLVEDDESEALNTKFPSELEPMPAAQLSENLRRLILKLYADYLSDDGRSVDYAGMAKSEQFEQYVKLSAELQRTEVGKMTRQETLAFFINIYNALVVHANIERGPPISVWQRYKFFNTVSYNIGGQLYCLQDIENGVLRANRKGVGQVRAPFSRTDPRLCVSLDRCEPLIHFALVCGAKSCPPIKTYTAPNIDQELRLAASSFLDGEAVGVSGNVVSLSRILKWYAGDFGANKHEILAFIVEHLPSESEKRAMLAPLLKSRSYSIEYQTYDWSLNGSS
ncbi:uncharacterized protein LOC135805404 [Sycon ciliatum]|uniref:uncharacterized protein LOC135805404 n=1 Tax=Sycon ciliatum TaxID=27933 RepID=UPI0020ABFB7F